MFQILRAVPGDIEGPDGDVHRLLGALVKPGDQALGSGVDNVRLGRIWGDIAALTAADVIPVLAPNHAVVIVTLDGYRAVVLLRAVDVVRPAIVSDHVIELGGRLVVLRGPGIPAVDGDGGSAVVAVDHTLRIVRIQPQAVMIAVRS